MSQTLNLDNNNKVYLPVIIHIRAQVCCSTSSRMLEHESRGTAPEALVVASHMTAMFSIALQL